MPLTGCWTVSKISSLDVNNATTMWIRKFGHSSGNAIVPVQFALFCGSTGDCQLPKDNMWPISLEANGGHMHSATRFPPGLLQQFRVSNRQRPLPSLVGLRPDSAAPLRLVFHQDSMYQRRGFCPPPPRRLSILPWSHRRNHLHTQRHRLCWRQSDWNGTSDQDQLVRISHRSGPSLNRLLLLSAQTQMYADTQGPIGHPSTTAAAAE